MRAHILFFSSWITLALCLIQEVRAWSIDNFSTGNRYQPFQNIASRDREVIQTLTGSRQPKIVGGILASFGEFEFIASLRAPGVNGHYCGGSLVRPNVVMTAAHCVESITPAEVWVGGLRVDNAVEFEILEVDSIRIHKYYTTDSNTNDIALIFTRQSSSIAPVDLNADPGNEADSKTVTVAGWGTTREGGDISRNLLKVDVPMVSYGECRGLLGRDVSPGMICAGVLNGGKDSCQGDSGGPLMIKKGSRWLQTGIVSWGDGCAEPCKPGVYTQVSAYSCWLSEMLDNNASCSNPESVTPPSSNIGVTSTSSKCQSQDSGGSGGSIGNLFDCFPGVATVELASGQSIPLRDLQVGEEIRISSSKTDKVFFFSHRDPDLVSTSYLNITTTANHNLIVSAGHLLRTSDPTMPLVASSRLEPRIHRLIDAEGHPVAIRSIRKVSHPVAGLYNPHTTTGTILVNGIQASCYTTAIHPTLAHAALLIERAARALNLSVLGPVLDKHHPSLQRLLNTLSFF